MNDLAQYTRDRAVRDPEFAENLEFGYTEFKIGVLLRQAREKARKG
jgi:HTH-type transcriptional regulator/antitoxin HipB